MIILHKCFDNSNICHELLVVALEEKSALVPKHSRFENEYTGQGSRDFLHCVHGGAAS
jgi:hypothetical protein